MTRAEAVKIFLEQTRTLYIDEQSRQRIRASGKSARSLRTTSAEQGGQMRGLSYFYFLTNSPKNPVGRKPGGFPPIESIIQWIKDKKTFKVDTSDGNALKSLAYAIARKIAKEGTDIYQGRRPAMNVEAKVAEYRKQLVQNIIDNVKEETLDKLKILKDGSVSA